MEEGVLWRRLRDMYGNLRATHKKNVAQKLYNKDLSDKDELFI